MSGRENRARGHESAGADEPVRMDGFGGTGSEGRARVCRRGQVDQTSRQRRNRTLGVISTRFAAVWLPKRGRTMGGLGNRLGKRTLDATSTRIAADYLPKYVEPKNQAPQSRFGSHFYANRCRLAPEERLDDWLARPFALWMPNLRGSLQTGTGRTIRRRAVRRSGGEDGSVGGGAGDAGRRLFGGTVRHQRRAGRYSAAQKDPGTEIPGSDVLERVR